MKTRALCLFVGLSIATPLAAGDPGGGDACPFGLADEQLRFDQVVGPLAVTEMAAADPDTGSLPCGYSASIGLDGKRAWVGVDVAALPRHLAVTVDLDADASRLTLQPEESVEVLEVSSASPQGPAATVSLTSDHLVLAWRNGEDKVVTQRARPGSPFTLVLVVDRGRGARGSLTLSVPGDSEPPLRLDPVNLASIPISGSPAARVRFGAIVTSPMDLGVDWSRGWLRFRPIAIESGWGRK